MFVFLLGCDMFRFSCCFLYANELDHKKFMLFNYAVCSLSDGILELLRNLTFRMGNGSVILVGEQKIRSI